MTQDPFFKVADYKELKERLQDEANQNRQARVSFGLIILRRWGPLDGHMVGYWATPEKVWFIDAQSIVNGEGTAVFDQFEPYIEHGSEYIQSVFYLPIGPKGMCVY